MENNNDIKKTVLITGCTQGLGLFLSKEFRKDGYFVIGVDRHKRNDLINSRVAYVDEYFYCDLSELDSITQLVHEVFAKYKIGILINNAGIKTQSILSDYSDEKFHEIMKVNFFAPVKLCKVMLPFFNGQGFGRIINISSNASFWGYHNGTAYCSSKSALTTFSQSLAYELPLGITINSINPATIFTEEFMKESQIVSKGEYILPIWVYKTIIRLINGNYNGKVIAMISLRRTLSYIFHLSKLFLNSYFIVRKND